MTTNSLPADQELRLESVRLALSVPGTPSPTALIQVSDKIYSFIKDGTVPEVPPKPKLPSA